MGDSQNYGYLFGGPHNKDYSILGSILGSPYFGKLPIRVATLEPFLPERDTRRPQHELKRKGWRSTFCRGLQVLQLYVFFRRVPATATSEVPVLLPRQSTSTHESPSTPSSKFQEPTIRLAYMHRDTGSSLLPIKRPEVDSHISLVSRTHKYGGVPQIRGKEEFVVAMSRV